MKKIILMLCMFLATAFISNSVFAEGIKVGTFPIPLMVENKDKGVFIELFKEIAKRANLEPEISVSPPKRTLGKFAKGAYDVIFPALDVFFDPNNMPIKSKELLYVKKDFVFTKKGSPLLKTVADLEGKPVGITAGYPYARELVQNPKIKIQAASSDEINAKKLIAGRIAAFVVEEKSGLKAFEKTGNSDKFQYDPNTPLSAMDVYFAFAKNEKGKRFEQAISKALAEMKKDGTFQKIMSKAQ